MDVAPPPVHMVQLLAGFQVSQALYAAAKLGIPDQLADRPRSAPELARLVQADPQAIARLLRTLTAFGVVTRDEDTYSLTPLGETLCSDTAGSMRDLALMWMETHSGPFERLVDTVRTGIPAATDYYGRPFFDWLATDHARVEQFSGAMANLTNGIKAEAVANYDFGTPRQVVDVGGADGTLLTHLLARLPDTSGIVYDLPHVVGSVSAVAKENALEQRLSGEGGDFFHHVPSGGDLYLLSLVLHDWNDPEASKILANIAAAAPSGTPVRAVELVVPDNDAPHMSKMVDLTMLGMLTGRERDEREMRHLFTSAGLVFDRIVPTPTPLSIVEARTP